jgi:hypothetical protein
MVHFAEKYFNDPELVHPQKGSTLKRSGKMPTMEKAQMCFYTEATTISTSMLHLHNPMNVATAVGLYRDTCKLLSGDLKPESAIMHIMNVVSYCLEQPELCDEIYCQLIRQTNNNPEVEAQLRGWHLLCVCAVSFPPGKELSNYLKAYMMVSQKDQYVNAQPIFPPKFAPNVTDV